MAIAEKGEVTKLQQHLSLLKEEYVKLQAHCIELERKYALVASATGEVNENSFVAKLLRTVAELFDQQLYSDMKVKLNGRLIPAHRFVLAARSEYWGVPSLVDVDFLDWSDLVPEVGTAVLKWVYTDQVDFSHGDSFTLDLMRTANVYKLEDLVAKYGKPFMILSVYVVGIFGFGKLKIKAREHFLVFTYKRNFLSSHFCKVLSNIVILSQPFVFCGDRTIPEDFK